SRAATSRPNSSVPSQCCADGGLSRTATFVASGSAVTTSLPRSATTTQKVTTAVHALASHDPTRSCRSSPGGLPCRRCSATNPGSVPGPTSRGSPPACGTGVSAPVADTPARPRARLVARFRTGLTPSPSLELDPGVHPGLDDVGEDV